MKMFSFFVVVADASYPIPWFFLCIGRSSFLILVKSVCICLSNRSILQRYSIFMLIPRFFLSVSTLFHFFCHFCCSPESLEFCLYINILLSFKMTSVSWVTITTRGHHHSNRKPLRSVEGDDVVEELKNPCRTKRKY